MGLHKKQLNKSDTFDGGSFNREISCVIKNVNLSDNQIPKNDQQQFQEYTIDKNKHLDKEENDQNQQSTSTFTNINEH